MSFFDKMKASVGIGAAKVDAVLEKDNYIPGETVKGVIHIVGGKVDQEVNYIALHTMTHVLRESDDKKFYQPKSVQKVKVSDRLTIHKGERKEIPFSFILPEHTPLSYGKTKVWIKTELDVSLALDPTDKDYLQVGPHPSIATLLNALQSLGFQIKKANAPTSHRSHYGFVQEIEFYPGGKFRGRLDELEVVYTIDKHGVNIVLEVDRRARGLSGLLSEALEMDETKLRFNLTHNEMRNETSLKNQLENAINRYS